LKRDTSLVHLGRHPERFEGAVSTPVFRASTVISATLDEWNAKKARKNAGLVGFTYGRSGTPNTHSLNEAVAGLEGGHAAASFPSGLAACATAILSVVRAGDHILAADGIYGPVRRLAGSLLKRMNVEVSYFSPSTVDIEPLMRPNTTVVYLESPASHTMEFLDVPALAAIAHRHGARVLADNTWSGLTFFPAFERGIDISIHAATKYIVGHSDAVAGIAVANADCWDALHERAAELGQTLSPDDAFLALRGIRTLGLRMRQHDENGRRLADWLAGRPEVVEVRHPCRPEFAGHDLWKRDFTGASGLFTIRLAPHLAPHMAAFVDTLELFGIGASWGGFESLVLPTSVSRTAEPADLGGLVRIHAGLEDPDDLIADLERGLAALVAAGN
jgi:cystathionine beta-lyase